MEILLLIIFTPPAIIFTIAIFWFAFNNDLDNTWSLESITRIFKKEKETELRQHEPKPKKPVIIVNVDNYSGGQHHGGYYAYIVSDEWKSKREIAKLIDGYKCTVCRSTKNLQVHHTNYNSLYYEERNGFRDVTTLCRACHMKHHGIDPKTNKKYVR